ncbi:MAG: cell surface protein SprA [Bacteroidaceae bacterium]|nr:cell surface protein SprA [Bacteroidaceae bacterium]
MNIRQYISSYLLVLILLATAYGGRGELRAADFQLSTFNFQLPADSLRVRPQRTTPETVEDLDTAAVSLHRPDNLKQVAEMDSLTGYYRIGTKLGKGGYLDTPILMSPEQYQQWSLWRSMQSYYRRKNQEAYESDGKNKFDFSDMNFDLGPAEKIFGPGGVSIKTQGSAELKMGVNIKNVKNPSLAASRRKTVGFDFDEKINLSVTGKVGDKVNMNINYNTDATFDMDAQQMKLKYDGKEDEIIKLVEAGNVSMPSNSTLIRGVSSLFGLRTDVQFGKLKLQAVVSQKNSASKSASSKGGSQTTNYEISAVDYEENRHFWLSHYFRDNYDRWMKTLPTIASGITLKRVELWVTNKNASTQNNRSIIAFTDLGEVQHISNPLWHPSAATSQPQNRGNTLYDEINQNYPDARDISQATTVLDAIEGFNGGIDYEKLQSARLLTSSEYTLNAALGYVSLNFQLQPDEVLAVAFEYTLNGQTFQVGEFASDLTDNTKSLYVKVVKSTSNSPRHGCWPLMMKNIYNLGATSTQREKFRLDIKYQNDTAGVYQTYLPEAALKATPLLRAMNLDRLDNNNRSNSDGQFDYVEGYTISKGRIIFPVAEPFGDHLRQWIGNDAVADKYCFDALYDSTKTIAKQNAEQDKFLLAGRYKGTNGAEIDLGATNIAPGSVHVTGGGVELTENVDYRVDYSMGIVTITNQSLIDSGTKISASVESNDVYGMQRKTFLGLNWDYEFSKNLVLGGTFQYLNEQPLTTKVNMGSEPLKNTLWGLHLDWKKESQWLTNALNAIPLLNFTAPSQISFSGDFAQLIAGQNGQIQGGASYMDDFENTKTRMSISSPTAWMLSSVPYPFEGSKMTNDVRSGYQRAHLAWYYIDPIFTRRSSTLTPAHIKGDLEQLSNHYVREVYERELYPNKRMDSYSGAASLNVLNLAYYPSERGAYNLNPNLDTQGRLLYPKENWGGMMRKTDNPDFEAQNIEYIEFWMLDPFIYTGDDQSYGGELYIDLGEVSEDVLKDGKKFYESGLPIDENPQYYAETVWGRVPTSTTSVTYAFNNESGARARQDVGLNGLSSEQERTFGAYQEFLTAIQGRVSPEVFDSIAADPAADDYHYYRGSDYDRDRVSILDRYKRINLPEGNSPDTNNSPESYETAYKTSPDVEDINQDYTLNEYEKYFQYHISIHPGDTVVGRNYISDIRRITPKLRNGRNDVTERWFQFRVPLEEYERAVGGITDFTSIRFIRMYMTGFEKPVILRFATLDLVQADWRQYEQSLYPGKAPAMAGTMEVGAVNIDENSDKQPVNYVLPPGISPITDPAQTQLVEQNEQALSMIAKNLAPGDARAVFKNCNYDMRQYKHLQLFVHANALMNDVTDLRDGETSIFLRVGSDYKSNFYEYEVPLQLTPEGKYDRYSPTAQRAVWPAENMIDIDLEKFTALKKNRNREKSLGNASYNQEFSEFDSDRPNNKITVMGNPTLGEVKTIMIGVRNNGRTLKSVEVWANELRLQEFSNDGGWAAQGTLNVQLSDLGSVNVQGHIERAGFGGIEQSVSERSNDDTYEYNITTQMDLGKLLPPKAKVSVPFYYSYGSETVKPKYNPLDTDMLLSDALDAAPTSHEKDSITSLTTRKQTTKNISFSGVKVNIQSKKHPMPYDPANFTFNYSHTSNINKGETTVYEYEKTWRGGMNYSWSPNWKAWEPFKNIKGKSKWLDLVKAQNLSFAPQSITFNTDIVRTYYEIQERDMENLESPDAIPVRWTPSFLWNREFSLRWDLTKALHFNFQSATHAEIEEPYTPVNKELYPDSYSAWKDSVWHSIKGWGTPLDYQQSATASYKVPFEKIPVTDWISSDVSYQSSYSWKRGAELEDGSTLGNTINTQRTININGKMNMETLYNHSTFLKDANKRFSASTVKSEAKKKDQAKKTEMEAKKKEEEAAAKARADAEKKAAAGDSTALKALNDPSKAKTQTNAKGTSQQKKQVKGFAGEVVLPDTAVELKHGQKSNRITVTAKTEDGKAYAIKYKRVDENTIKIYPSKQLMAAAKQRQKEAERAKKEADRQQKEAEAKIQKARKQAEAELQKVLKDAESDLRKAMKQALAAADSAALDSLQRRSLALDSLVRSEMDLDSIIRASLAATDSTLLAAFTSTASEKTPKDSLVAQRPTVPGGLPDGKSAPSDSTSQPSTTPLKLRVNVVAKPKLEDEKWYQWAQAGARFLMMLRNVSVSYRNTYNLALPGFRPNVGDMLGQRRTSGVFSPGVDFAFGLVGDSYIDRAQERGWLMNSDSVATPATTNTMEDLQIKATLEPLPDLKIDLNASRTTNRAKSIQYMYAGNPTTQTGSFNMTTISIKTAFASRGNAANGYDSKTFREFQRGLDIMQERVEQRYMGTEYPKGTGMNGTFNPENGTVNRYSADVMVPAFLAAYTGGNMKGSPLDIFPAVTRMLPNWSFSYKGLSNLPWIREHLKSLTLTHGYKSIYSVGSYNTFSSWIEYMGGSDMGYVQNATTGTFVPSSMYDISNVSINEAFSPLIGLNATLQNNMTLKLEYRKTRVITLSMTSAQINEACSSDIVFGMGYKINDFKIGSLFGSKSNTQKASAKNRRNSARGKNGEDDDQQAGRNNRNNNARNSGRSSFSHDLNLRLDISQRYQDAITRDIQTSLSEATSGNSAFKLSFAADYSMSRYVTFSLYYDLQRNEPLLSSSAYPTITQDFGFNMRFQLTR